MLRPDWSVITTLGARAALAGRMAARSGLLDKWSHALARDEDQVWQSVLCGWVAEGQPPTVHEIAVQTGIGSLRVAALLRNLQLRDLVGLEPDSGAIRHAYPFTVSASGHRVELGRHTLNALCAVDALGAGDMCRMDIAIDARCRSCGESVRVETVLEGRRLGRMEPERAVVWYDFAYEDSAASSCCQAIAFFCSEQHLREWLGLQRTPRAGARLAMDEALELGRAIFGPVFAIAPVEPSSVGVPPETSEGERK